MLVTVIGSTGTVGSELVRLLSQRAISTRAVFRTPAERPALEHVDWVQADLREPEQRRRALAGTTRMFLLTDNRSGFGELQTRIVHSAERAGVAYALKLSAFGASPRSSSAIGREHWQVEQTLQQTAMAWTILRPHAFMQDWLGDVAVSTRTEGMVYSPIGAARVPFIDARDVAAVAAAVLADPGAYIGRKLFLTGGAAVSFAELSAALSLELGTPVSYREISLEQAQSRWQARGLPADVVEGLLAFAAYQREGGASAATSDCVSAILGRSPRDIRDFVCDYRAHFVPR